MLALQFIKNVKKETLISLLIKRPWEIKRVLIYNSVSFIAMKGETDPSVWFDKTTLMDLTTLMT